MNNILGKGNILINNFTALLVTWLVALWLAGLEWTDTNQFDSLDFLFYRRVCAAVVVFFLCQSAVLEEVEAKIGTNEIGKHKYL